MDSIQGRRLDGSCHERREKMKNKDCQSDQIPKVHWGRIYAACAVLTSMSFAFWMFMDFAERGGESINRLSLVRRLFLASDTCAGILGWAIVYNEHGFVKLEPMQGIEFLATISSVCLVYSFVLYSVGVIFWARAAKTVAIRHGSYCFVVLWFFSGLTRAVLRVS